MKTTNNKRSGSTKIWKTCLIFCLGPILSFVGTAQSQSQASPNSNLRELYNEMLDATIWISPSRSNPNAITVYTALGISYDITLGGISFSGSTQGGTVSSGGFSTGGATSCDGRQIQLNRQGQFQFYFGAVSSNVWLDGGGGFSGVISPESGTGLYGTYKDAQTGRTMIVFLYSDGRWGAGYFDGRGNLLTDKGMFH